MIYTPYILPPLFAAVILAGLALYARRFRGMPAVRPFNMQMWLGVWYALSDALAISTIWLPLRVFWFQLSYVALTLFPPTVLLLALEYTGNTQWLTRRWRALLFSVPSIFILLALTSTQHTLFQYNYQMDWSDALPVLLFERGPWFWVLFIYSITLTMIACGLLLASFRTRKTFFWNMLAIVTGFLIPVFSQTLFEIGITPIHNYNFASTMLVFSGLCFGWAILRGQLFDVTPIARDAVMDYLDDLVIVVDSRNHIVDFNNAARAACHLTPQILGASPDTLPPAWADLFRHYRDNSSCKTEVSISTDESQRHYELTIAPLLDKHHNLLGRLFVLNDITERKRAEQSFQESLDSLNKSQAISHIGNWSWDIRADRFRSSNEGFRLMGFGLTSQPTLADITERIHPDDRARAHAVRTAALETGKPYCIELRIFKQGTGELRHILSQAEIERDADGNPIRLFGINQDITERKQTEKALRASEEQFRSFVENANDIVYSLTLEGIFTYVSHTWTEILGHDAQEVIGRFFGIFVHPDDLPACRAFLERTITTGEKSGIEYRVRHKAGTWHWHMSNGSLIRDADDNIVSFMGIARDITERKQMEAALRESEGKYRILLEESPDPIFSFTPEGRYTFVNRAFAEGVGKPVGDILDKTMWEVFPKSEADGRFAALKQALKTGEINVIEVCFPEPNGDQYYLTTITPIRDRNGLVLSAICSSKNITVRKRIETAERKQRVLAEALRDTAAALNSTLKFDDVLDRILANASRVVPHDAANIMLLNPTDGTLSIARTRGYVERGVEDVARLRLSLEALPILKQAARIGQPAIIPSTHADPAWFSNPKTRWVHSYAGAPIRIRERTIGFLNLDSATPNFFNSEHAEQLQVFADQAAIAIENARLYTEVQELAITDALTGVYNRRGLFQLGEREVERALRFQHPLTAIMLDIDHFKHVNDTYGHPTGDRVLCALTEICQAQVRNVDLITRYGGEEFVLLLPETDTIHAIEVAERLRQAVEVMRVPVEADASTASTIMQVTISQGIVTLKPNTPNLTALITRVDQALYDAKQAGRNCIAVGA